MKRKILNKNWKIKRWLILGHFFLLLIIILFVSQNCAFQVDQKAGVLLPEPAENLELPDDFSDEAIEDWLEDRGTGNKAPFTFIGPDGSGTTQGNIVVDLSEKDNGRYGGIVIVYGGGEKGGTFYSKNNDVSKNEWIENNSGGLIWTGVFQNTYNKYKGDSNPYGLFFNPLYVLKPCEEEDTSKVGGAIVIVTDKVFYEGEGYSTQISGTVWLKELPSIKSCAPFPPNPCWLVSDGAFDCRFGLGNDHSPTNSYVKWGTFEGLNRIEAGLIEEGEKRGSASVKEEEMCGIKIIRNFTTYLKSFFKWLKSLVKGS